MGAVATISPKKSRLAPRECDYAAYRGRHLVECFIRTRKYCRRAFARYDKCAKRFRAIIHFACTRGWLK